MFIAIIQARLGSTRLPGKVMKEVLGKPLIGYLLERVSLSKYIDKIILATTINSDDDTLVDYVLNLGYEVFRGSEDDVLLRYYNAYKSLYNHKNISGIVRITGDCPLIEAQICDKLINYFSNNDLDYSYLSHDYAEGLDCEIFKPSLLEEANSSSKLPSEREHVTQYFHNNSDRFKVSPLSNQNDDSQYRITVDEVEDFEVVKNIIEYFTNNRIEINFLNIKKYLDDNLDIFSKNSHIIRNAGLLKSLENE